MDIVLAKGGVSFRGELRIGRDREETEKRQRRDKEEIEKR